MGCKRKSKFAYNSVNFVIRYYNYNTDVFHRQGYIIPIIAPKMVRNYCKIINQGLYYKKQGGLYGQS
jgi:hypothetical protein